MCHLWASRRPPGEARGARIPGVCKRRATKPGGMHRRPEWRSYFRTGPKFLTASRSMMVDVRGALMPCDPQILKQVPLFALLDDDETAVLAAHVEVKQFA